MQPITMSFRTIVHGLAFTIALASCSNDAKDSSKKKEKDKKPLEVNARIATPSKLEDNVGINGALLANEQIELKAEAQGKIIALYLQEGAQVKKGSLLAKLNDADLQATLRKQKAQEAQLANEERRKKTSNSIDINQ